MRSLVYIPLQPFARTEMITKESRATSLYKTMILENITHSNNELTLTDPPSNTGSDSQLPSHNSGGVEARIDNLSLLWRKNGSIDIRGVLRRMLGITFDDINVIGRKIGVWWDRNYSSCCGAILSERDAPNGAVYCRLSLGGESCGRVSNLRLRGFMLWARANLRNLTCSRVDLAVDDFSNCLQLTHLQTASEQGDYVGFKESKATINYGKKHNGWTVNYGARTGEKYLRIYDKFAESRGKINSTRFEVEFSGKQSNALFQLILGFPQNELKYQAELINYAIGCISFVEKVDKNLDRNQLTDWWYEWLEYLKCCPKKAKVIRIKTSINSKKQWINRSVSKSLSLLYDAIGTVEAVRYINVIISEARQRYTNFDRMLLDDYRMVCDRVKLGHNVVTT